jgi:non-lysosomal glucosylceramidase
MLPTPRIRWIRALVFTPLAVTVAVAAAESPAAVAERLNREAGTGVPTVKHLDPAWIAHLADRGSPRTYTRENSADFAYIGMPVGGIGAGQVYLGGDGKLWWWDIFNSRIPKGDFPVEQGAAYMKPPRETDSQDTRPTRIEQGFGLRVTVGDRSWLRRLDRTGFKDIEFSGTYPIGRVNWRDPDVPVDVALEAFSPFVPLAVEDSDLPAVILRYHFHNHGAERADLAVMGWIENAVMLGTPSCAALRQFERIDGTALTFLNAKLGAVPAPRPPVQFESWFGSGFSGWVQSGTAFGSGPSDLDSGAGSVTRSAASRHSGGAKSPGKLTSRPFRIEHSAIEFRIAGSTYRTKTCLNLVVDGKVARTATGRDSRTLAAQSWDVRDLIGQTATLEIVDTAEQSDASIAVGPIAFVDYPLQDAPAFGTMGLALLGRAADAVQLDLHHPPIGDSATDNALLGSLERHVSLAAGAAATVEFVLTWCFPNSPVPKIATRRAFARRFDSAFAVASHVSANLPRLVSVTETWDQTWNDSTLPHWFLDRTFANTSTLATSTTFLLDDGRYYAYEGVYSCPGTCGHVYQYAQAAGHLFPSLERDVRTRVDLGLAFDQKAEPGVIDFRGEYGGGFAVDAQAGTLLRIYREHRMSANDAWLRAIWPRVRQAYDPLFALDPGGNGILEGAQMNTLDKPWFGRIAWLSGLYLAALRAGEAMAHVCGDEPFATRCHAIAAKGYAEVPRQLFSDGYFISRVDPAKPDSINSGTGCEIDQVLGQSWAFQDGLPRVFPPTETRSALASLWRYNFTTDIGRYRKTFTAGRWYGTDGEAGLVMCTFPRPDWNYQRAAGAGPAWAAGYLDEVMTGFEHQVAAHMLWENMVPEGLAIERAIDERYDAAKRNPWNEVECGSHYGRAMASYGVYLAACGFTYDGPRGALGFAPRVTPEDFRAAFTAAEGWGSYAQHIEAGAMTADVALKWGTLRLRILELAVPEALRSAKAQVGGQSLAAAFERTDAGTRLTFPSDVNLRAGDVLHVTLQP